MTTLTYNNGHFLHDGTRMPDQWVDHPLVVFGDQPGTNGDDTLRGNLLYGWAGNDTLETSDKDRTAFLQGGLGNDVIAGGNANDHLVGGAGDDTIMPGTGSDRIDGGSGENDHADYSSEDLASFGINLNLVTAEVKYGLNSDYYTDTLTSIEHATGNQKDDSFIGNSEANRFYGLGGDDYISGKGGNDTLEGGAGADTLDGGDGTDWASYAGAASGVTVSLKGFQFSSAEGDALGDTFASIENLAGSAHDDHLVGDNGANHIRGGAGDDYIDAAQGADTLEGGAGDDRLISGQGNDIMTGGAGADTFSFGSHALTPGGHDTITDYNPDEGDTLDYLY
ncbi:MAG: hypothetical protein GDA53_03805, partial [Rhodobacteraceae bacterium]|nr:hypothetical protein [Paracoccaceae bacterium]